jgi:hypothetical protein
MAFSRSFIFWMFINAGSFGASSAGDDKALKVQMFLPKERG